MIQISDSMKKENRVPRLTNLVIAVSIIGFPEVSGFLWMNGERRASYYPRARVSRVNGRSFLDALVTGLPGHVCEPHTARLVRSPKENYDSESSIGGFSSSFLPFREYYSSLGTRGLCFTSFNFHFWWFFSKSFGICSEKVLGFCVFSDSSAVWFDFQANLLCFALYFLLFLCDFISRFLIFIFGKGLLCVF